MRPRCDSFVNPLKSLQKKKENIYLLTEKGIDLAPLILEIVLWSDKYVRIYNTEMNSYENQNLDKSLVIESVQIEYRKLVCQILN